MHGEIAAAVPIRYRGHLSNPDLLDLVEGDLVTGPVVELGGARAGMGRHRLWEFRAG